VGRLTDERARRARPRAARLRLVNRERAVRAHTAERRQAAVITSGQPLRLEDQLLDTDGDPLTGAEIEPWQADTGGVYLDATGPGGEKRDPYFQSYGAATSGDDGTSASTR